MKVDKVKLIGFLAAVIGMGATFISNWADDRKMEEMIDKKVDAALSKNEVEESE